MNLSTMDGYMFQYFLTITCLHFWAEFVSGYLNLIETEAEQWENTNLMKTATET